MLQQQVSKWVQAHPLPAKVSEARLYSLEARLAEETNARLNIEAQIGMSGGTLVASLVTPRTGTGGEHLVLPHLAPLPGAALPPQGFGGEAGGRSMQYDNYRQQSGRQHKPITRMTMI